MNTESIAVEEEEKPVEIDSQFILRLPAVPANALRTALKNESKSLKERFKIEIDTTNMRQAIVQFENWTLPARIYDLPSVVESYKTFDSKVFYKVADICQIMICRENDDESDCEESQNAKLDKDGRDKKYLFPHGVTPCLKNVRKRRFRKTLRKRSNEAPSVESEVKMLLKTDAEAISSRFELVEDDKIEKKPSVQDAEEKGNNSSMELESNAPPTTELAEYIFGHVSSSSEDSNDSVDVAANGGNSSLEFPSMSVKSESMAPDDFLENELITVKKELDDNHCVSFTPEEEQTAQQNLHHMLKRDNDYSKPVLLQQLSDLACSIANLQSQRQSLESDIQSIENLALRERYQMNIDGLKADEKEKAKEYDKIYASLQVS